MIGIHFLRIWWTTVSKMCLLMSKCTTRYEVYWQVSEAKALALSIKYKALLQSKQTMVGY